MKNAQATTYSNNILNKMKEMVYAVMIFRHNIISTVIEMN